MDCIKTNFITPSEFPLVIEPSHKNVALDDLKKLLEQRNNYFKQHLLKYGAVLLRNFPIKNDHDFADIIRSFKTGHFLDYIGGDSPRTKITDGVYTSTEAPPWIKIPLHNELSFVKHYPTHIYFYCDIAPKDRGETIIGDARKIYQSIDEDVRNRFIEKKLRYISCYYYKSKLMSSLNKIQKFHKSWIDVFETEDKQEVERKCYENEFSFKWTKGDWLQISQERPAVLEHPETHELVWFNQAHLYDFNPKLVGWPQHLGLKVFYFQEHTRLHQIFFADNSKIPRKDLYHILDVLDQNTVSFPWQKGDMLVLDNILAMHGRAPFSGKRRVLASMTG